MRGRTSPVSCSHFAMANNEDLARATAPGATEADVWMFKYRHGELPKTPETEERELVDLLTRAGYAVRVTDTQIELPLAA